MSDPERMGIGVPTGVSGSPRQRHCPGAMIRVSREDYTALRREGLVFTTSPNDIRAEGLSDARALCHNEVATIRVPQYEREGKMVHALYDAALCAGCAEMERNNRADLAARAASRPR